ncbi:MAG: hypothetical protein AB7C97_09565 [Oscillospiraceae bacterium]
MDLNTLISSGVVVLVAVIEAFSLREPLRHAVAARDRQRSYGGGGEGERRYALNCAKRALELEPESARIMENIRIMEAV